MAPSSETETRRLALSRGTGPRRTMHRGLADSIREEILSGKLRPLQRLSQDELSVRLGVSRMPVREALRVLDSEGLVKITPHCGAVVTDISAADIREIYAIRRLLEGFAAELGAARIARPKLEELRALLQQMKGFTDKEAPIPPEIHQRFHLTIYDAAEMVRLSQQILSLWPASERYRRFYSSLPGRRAKGWEYHEKLVRHCEERDGPGARQTTIDHLSLTEETVLNNLKNSIFS